MGRWGLVLMLFIGCSMLVSAHGMVPSGDSHGHSTEAATQDNPDVTPPTRADPVRNWTAAAIVGITAFAAVAFYQFEPDAAGDHTSATGQDEGSGDE